MAAAPNAPTAETLPIDHPEPDSKMEVPETGVKRGPGRPLGSGKPPKPVSSLPKRPRGRPLGTVKPKPILISLVPKRPRGRPPGKVVKRAPGRPRKFPKIEVEGNPAPIVKRPRGRPSSGKVVKPKPVSVKRGRGRPAKASKIAQGDSVSGSVKRRPGRPPKAGANLTPKPEPSSGDGENKRKRGRPKMGSGSGSGKKVVPPSSVGRPRGRPKKQIPEVNTDSAVNDEHPTPLPITHAVPVSARKPVGRPRKLGVSPISCNVKSTRPAGRPRKNPAPAPAPAT